MESVVAPGEFVSPNKGDATPDGANSTLLAICSFLSATVVVNTFFYKAPQVYAITNSGSSQGISLLSVVLEWIAYSIMLTYHYAMSYPLETYLEVVMMVLQDLILVAVILHNRKMVDWNLLPWSLLYLVGFLLIGLNVLPSHMMVAAVALMTPILCWSKVDQLTEIYWTRDPGSLSALTWFISVYDTGVRILTTVVITKDIPMFVNLTTSQVLNVAILASIVYFNRMKKLTRRH